MNEKNDGIKTKKCPVCKRVMEEREPGAYKCLCGYGEFKATGVEAEREEKTLWKGKYLEMKRLAQSFLEECEYSYEFLKDQEKFNEDSSKFYKLMMEDENE